MEPFVRNFLRSSLLWLGAGVIMGVWMTVDPGAIVYRPAHMHANLLGFASMMIFGVAYHVIPRFTGTPLRSRVLPTVHLVVANAGLATMVAGFLLRGMAPDVSRIVLPVGGALSAFGAFLFIGNIWLTLGASAGSQLLARPQGLRP